MHDAMDKEPIQFSESDYATFPSLAGLTRREVWVAELYGVSTWPESQPSAVEVSQSVGRSRVTRGHTPCVCPGSRIYLPHLCRLTHQLENMWLQGIYYNDEVVMTFEEKEIR